VNSEQQFIVYDREGTMMNSQKSNSTKKKSSKSFAWVIWPIVGVGAMALMLRMQQPPVASSADSTPSTSSSAAPAFTLTDINGGTVSLSDFKGKVVILDFWATWCPPCKREIPDFITLQSEYASKGLQIVGIALDQPDKVRAFAQQNGMNYPVLLGTDQISALYGGIEGIPTTFILDKNGNIVNRFEGFRPKEDFEVEITKLL
jgi:peroxiredoxin